MEKATTTTQPNTFDLSEATLIGFDYSAAVGYLRDMISKLEGIEDYSNDMLDNIECMRADVARVDAPDSTHVDLEQTCIRVEGLLIELHNTANASAHWIDELLDQLKRLPMSE